MLVPCALPGMTVLLLSMKEQVMIPVTEGGRPPSADLPVIIESNGTMLDIGFEGFGQGTMTEGHGRPIVIEYYEGRLVLRVWADINSEEPTHVIDLSGAKEINYQAE